VTNNLMEFECVRDLRIDNWNAPSPQEVHPSEDRRIGVERYLSVRGAPRNSTRPLVSNETMMSHYVRMVVATAAMAVACDADILGWTTQFVARWRGGNKDLPAAVVTTSRQLFVAGSADGRGFSRVDGEAPGSTWCSHTVSLTTVDGSHVYDSQLCTGGATWSRGRDP
jgi:hypothetical protein